MVKFLLNGFLNGLLIIVNILTFPINTLLSSLFPNFNNYINNFNTMLNTYVIPNVGYFFNFLPPLFKSLLHTFIGFLVVYYSLYFTILAIKWVFNIIQKLKFW